MPSKVKCAVWNCDFPKKTATEKLSIFRVPRNEELRKLWQESVKNAGGEKQKELLEKHHVCSRHFEESDIRREWIHKDNQGQIIAHVQYGSVRLKNTAVPKIFKMVNSSNPSQVIVQDKAAENPVKRKIIVLKRLAPKPTTIGSNPSIQRVNNPKIVLRPLPASVIGKLANGKAVLEVPKPLKLGSIVSLAKPIVQLTNEPAKPPEASNQENQDGNNQNASQPSPMPESLEATKTEAGQSVPENKTIEIAPLQVAVSPVMKTYVKKITAVATLSKGSTAKSFAFPDQMEAAESPQSEATPAIVNSNFQIDLSNPNEVSILQNPGSSRISEHSALVLFTGLLRKLELITLPGPKWVRSYSIQGKKWIAFMEIEQKKIHQLEVYQKKCLLLNEKLDISCFIHGKKMEPTQIYPESKGFVESFDDVSKHIEAFGRLMVCPAVYNTRDISDVDNKSMYTDDAELLRHKECPVIVQIKGQCHSCLKLRRALQQRALRQKIKPATRLDALGPKSIDILKKKLRNERSQAARAKEKIGKLKEKLAKADDEIFRLKHWSVDDRCVESNLPKNQRVAVNEMFNAASKTNNRANRYSNDWLKLSTQILKKSPCCYEFLRDSSTLPLPASRTIRRILSANEQVSEEDIRKLKEYFDELNGDNMEM